MKSAVVALVGLAALAPASGMPQTFRVSVDAVRVDVLVTDGNQPIAGLRAGDFELRDRGVLQQIASVQFEDVPLSVMLALDISSSVDGEPLAHLKQAARGVATLLGPRDRAALLMFSGVVQLPAPWSDDHRHLEATIATAAAGGSTALHDAAYAALTLRDSQPGRTLVLIFSDGDDTASWLPGQHVIDAARRNDAVVYAVTLRTGAGSRLGYRLDFHSGIQHPIRAAPNDVFLEEFLEGLAEETGGKVIDAQRSDRLRQTFVQVLTEFRSRYLLTYTPRGVDSGGWHPIEVKLKGKRGKVTARRGYLR